MFCFIYPHFLSSAPSWPSPEPKSIKRAYELARGGPDYMTSLSMKIVLSHWMCDSDCASTILLCIHLQALLDRALNLLLLVFPNRLNDTYELLTTIEFIGTLSFLN